MNLRILLSVLALTAVCLTGYFVRVDSAKPPATLDIVKPYQMEVFSHLPMVIKILQANGHPALPQLAFAHEFDHVLVRMVFPNDIHLVSMFTDDVQARMRSLVDHFKRLGFAFDVTDKHELVNQFVITSDGQPILSSFEKVVLDTRNLADWNAHILDPVSGSTSKVLSSRKKIPKKQ